MHGETFHGSYCEFVGTLLYLAITSHSDILYSVSQVQEQPTDGA